MVEAVVEHDYEAQESDELNLRKGDIICNITIKTGGWWEGTLQRIGKRGMFPDNFVKILGGGDKKNHKEDSTQGQSNNNNNKIAGRKCVVLFAYKASVEDELDLNVGDIIDVLGEVEEGWWRGKIHNKSGVFPSNFVNLINENDGATGGINDSKKLIEETSKLIHEESKDINRIVNMSKTKDSDNNTADNTNTDNLPALPPKPSKELCKVLYQYKAANDDELNLEEGDIITIITKDVQDVGWWKGELNGRIGVFPDNFVKLLSPQDEVKPDRPTKVKSKDSITKSSSSASVYASSSSANVSRKFSDSIRPGVSVKPLLPPPTLKKPQLSPVENKTSRLSVGDISDTIPTKPSLIKQQEQEKHKHASETPAVTKGSNITSKNMSATSGSGNETKWTVIETSNDTADGVSWSRQSYSVTSSSSSNVISSSVTNVSNGTYTTTTTTERGAENLDLDLVSRSAMLTHPTASRAKVPKRRLPTTLLSRDDSRESDSNEGLVNGDTAMQHRDNNIRDSNNRDNNIRDSNNRDNTEKTKQPPWVEELKLNQAKKSISSGGSKTRVLISSSESGISSTSSSSEIVSRVALRQVPSHTQRPLSLQPGQRLSGGDSASSPPSADIITLSTAQWTQLCDKVTKLENDLEEQKKEFSKTIKELMETIDQQAAKQKKMMADIERLTDLVTQV